MRRTVSVVPHTHWDREWYRTFDAFRLRLVSVLDGVLDALERDGRWEGFHLDGQVAALDDYLELRPDAIDTVRRLSGEGRLAVGPWYVLMDEFCVSGETVLRNLEAGLGSAERVGAVSAIGYLPDMFGHISQMPQILRLAGIEHAVVWRGVPAAVQRTAFTWVSPDGSEVRAEYLPVGYASGAFLPDDPDALIRRVEALEAETAGFALAPDAPLLVMNGTDHQAIQAHVPATLESANGLQDRYSLELTTLSSYLAAARKEGLPCWSGELRSGARAPLLMGVLSNRRDLKVAAASAERSLERIAEPLATLWLTADSWPEEPLQRAWMEVIRNSAHDSICGCSADEVSRAVLHRYDVARAIADSVADDALELAAVAVGSDGPVVLNPSARTRSGIVELTLAGDEPPEGCQQTQHVPAGSTRREGVGSQLGQILGQLARDGWLPVGTTPAAATVAATGGRVELDLRCDGSRGGSPGAASVLAEAWALAGANRSSPLVVNVERSASQRVLARVASVPGYGWREWQPGPLDVDGVEVGAARMRNGLVDVEVDPLSGTFALDGLAGYARIVDGGDAGDTYNYCPPSCDTRVDSPVSVAVSAREAGPLRGRLTIASTYGWPQHLDGDRRVGSGRVEVVTELELRAGEGFVRATTRFVNRCRDHRVRVVFPLPEPAGTTTSECAFSEVERGAAEGGPREPALATYPSRRWVRAGGLTVVHDGMLEHELVAGGRELAVTVIRATGVLSRPFIPTRPNAAGPPVALEGAQMQGQVGVRYALAVGGADPWAMSDDVLLPLPVVHGTGTGHLPASGSRLAVSGAEVSALRRRGGSIELRVFNPSPETREVRIPGHRGSFVDLTGGVVGGWDGGFDLGPWKIANVRLESRVLD